MRIGSEDRGQVREPAGVPGGKVGQFGVVHEVKGAGAP
jgi:hypothetical protein